MTTIRTPTGLGRRGKALWRSAVGSFELRADELGVLEEAARTLDTLDRLEAELLDAPLTVPGSVPGTVRPHPLLAEVRAHRVVLGQLVRTLGFSDVADLGEDGKPLPTPRQLRAQHASQARWARPSRAVARG